MVFDSKFLDTLTLKAIDSPRLRMNYDLRDSLNDDSQRMLNAIEPSSFIPIHRHTTTSEDVAIVRGKVQMILYDEFGKEVRRVLLTPAGRERDSVAAIHIPIGQYHTCQSLESGSVIIEFKNTKYNPETTEDFL